MSFLASLVISFGVDYLLNQYKKGQLEKISRDSIDSIRSQVRQQYREKAKQYIVLHQDEIMKEARLLMLKDRFDYAFYWFKKYFLRSVLVFLIIFLLLRELILKNYKR